MDSKEPIPPGYVAWGGGGYYNRFPTQFLAPIDCLKIPAQITDRWKYKKNRFFTELQPKILCRYSTCLIMYIHDQGVKKRCRLSLLTNSAFVIRVQKRGKGGSCCVSANENSCVHHVTWIPNKLCRSTSIFNLYL